MFQSPKEGTGGPERSPVSGPQPSISVAFRGTAYPPACCPQGQHHVLALRIIEQNRTKHGIRDKMPEREEQGDAATESLRAQRTDSLRKSLLAKESGLKIQNLIYPYLNVCGSFHTLSLTYLRLLPSQVWRTGSPSPLALQRWQSSWEDRTDFFLVILGQNKSSF